MKKSKLVWGVILFTIGAVALLKQFDVINITWWSFFTMWPVVLVVIGVAILPIKSWLKASLIVISIVLGLALAPENHHIGLRYQLGDLCIYDDDCDYEDYTWSEQFLEESYDSTITKGRLQLDAMIGNFTLSETTYNLAEMSREGDAGPYKMYVNSNNGGCYVDIEPSGEIVRFGDRNNDVDLKLNQNVCWTVIANVGAAKLDLDLKNFNVKEVEVNGGACEIDLSISDKADFVEVYVNTGASSISFHLPKNCGCELITKTAFTGRSFSALERIGKRKYLSPNYDQKEKKIKIILKAAISDLSVDFY